MTALFLASVGCQGGWTPSSEGYVPGEGKQKACDIQLAAPKSEVVEGIGTIYVMAQATCDVPPVSHKINLRLEKKVGADWIPQASGDDPAWGMCEEIPHPDSWVRFERRLYKCEDGRYRTAALVTGSGPDGRSFSFAPPEKPEARVRCQKTGQR